MFKLLRGRRIKNLVIYSFYLPRIIVSVNNWKQYLQSYASSFSGIIRFRSGLRIKINDPSDASSVSVIFFKREYGTVKRNSVVLDIGANKGYFSVYAVNAAENIVVYSFEPIKDTYDSILENIKLNDFQHTITPFNKGVAGSGGIRIFSITSSISNSMVFDLNSEKQEKVECITLETIMKENKLSKVDLIKMDCEGAEYEIFYNTPKSYLKRISEIRMEYHKIDDDTLNVQSLINFMKNNRFEVTRHKPSTEWVGIIWFQQRDPP
jgi:FkbM family methyltransferase